jgi:hypothetical protein
VQTPEFKKANSPKKENYQNKKGLLTAQVVEHLPQKYKALCSIHNVHFSSFFAMLEKKPKASGMPSKHFSVEQNTKPHTFFFFFFFWVVLGF